MTKEELKEGKTYTFQSEYHTLEVDYREDTPNWASPYTLWFNAKFEEFKTFTGLKNRVDKLIERHSLTYIVGRL